MFETSGFFQPEKSRLRWMLLQKTNIKVSPVSLTSINVMIVFLFHVLDNLATCTETFYFVTRSRNVYAYRGSSSNQMGKHVVSIQVFKCDSISQYLPLSVDQSLIVSDWRLLSHLRAQFKTALLYFHFHFHLNHHNSKEFNKCVRIQRIYI